MQILERPIGLLKKYFPMSRKDWLIFFVSYFAASMICLLIGRIAASDVYAALIFVLAVLFTARFTDGYFYGLLAALFSVIAVNWAFTYPYMQFNFTIYGYPLTFVTMLAVGIVISTLTARVREQEKIRAESKKEEMRANLLRAVSHDLRTPLTTISGSISVLLDENCNLTDCQRKELLEDAKRDTDWLCGMVENLLSITRIRGDATQNIHKENEAIEEVFSDVVINFRNKNPNIRVSVSVPEELMLVPMDAMLVEQVLFNLMNNAVLHGGNTKSIRLTALPEGGFAVISVADDGKGIDSRIIKRLFDGSVNPSGGDSSRYMGIGLAVCRTIVEAHGGSIKGENRPEGGAIFTFTLKLGDTENEYQG